MARQRTPEGPPPAPAVQKLRVRYAKRGRLRFSSTRDFQRALERALRRAGVPMAFSAGFHPHPKISYANAAPTGTASEAEYFEISVTDRVDPEAVRDGPRRGAARGAGRARGGRGRARRARRPARGQRLGDGVRGAVRGGPRAGGRQPLLACERAEVTRTFKTGPRDLRRALRRRVAAQLRPLTAGCAILRVVVRHTTPAVRPDDVLTALRAVTELAPTDRHPW